MGENTGSGGEIFRSAYVYGDVFQLIAEHTDAPGDISEGLRDGST
jgi:hypothetical protein